jgi:type II secretory pathway pseudopilin PulG
VGGMSTITSARGFTLLETVVATGILVTALAGLAQLFVLGTHLTRQATESGAALVAAQDKLERLRGLTFGYGAAGEPVTDSALLPSSSSSLSEDIPPYVDWLDAAGEPHDDPDEAVMVRRWRVASVGETSPDAIAIEVCVFKAPAHEAGPQAADACLSTVRVRQP